MNKKSKDIVTIVAIKAVIVFLFTSLMKNKFTALIPILAIIVTIIGLTDESNIKITDRKTIIKFKTREKKERIPFDRPIQAMRTNNIMAKSKITFMTSPSFF